MELEKRVETLYQNLYFKTVKEKKIITMLKSIVIDKETELSIIAQNSSATEKAISKYINSKELILKYLSEDEYNQFLPYRDTINSKEKKEQEQEKYNLYQNLITDILDTRFTLEDICINNNIVVTTFDELLEDEEYLVQNFGKDIINQIKFRISETSIIRNSVPKDKKIIEDSWNLKVVRDQIHYLDSYELKMLNVVSSYIMTEGNIAFISEKYQMPDQMIYNYITEPKVKELIKEEYYKILKSCIKQEEILKSEDLNAKRDLIMQAVLTLKQCNYNLEETCKKMNIFNNLLLRILKDKLLAIIYTKKEIEQINEIILNEEKEN